MRENTELLSREIHQAHHSLLEPSPNDTRRSGSTNETPRSTNTNSSGGSIKILAHVESPTTSRKLGRRQTTDADEVRLRSKREKEKKVMRTYGSKGSQGLSQSQTQDDIWIRSTDPSPRKRRRVGTDVHVASHSDEEIIDLRDEILHKPQVIVEIQRPVAPLTSGVASSELSTIPNTPKVLSAHPEESSTSLSMTSSHDQLASSLLADSASHSDPMSKSGGHIDGRKSSNPTERDELARPTIVKTARSVDGQPKTSSKDTSKHSATDHDSDDSAIGVPKEQYMPRPSRSRAPDRNVDDMMQLVDWARTPESRLKPKKIKRRKTMGDAILTHESENEDEDGNTRDRMQIYRGAVRKQDQSDQISSKTMGVNEPTVFESKTSNSLNTKTIAKAKAKSKKERKHTDEPKEEQSVLPETEGVSLEPQPPKSEVLHRIPKLNHLQAKTTKTAAKALQKETQDQHDPNSKALFTNACEREEEEPQPSGLEPKSTIPPTTDSSRPTPAPNLSPQAMTDQPSTPTHPKPPELQRTPQKGVLQVETSEKDKGPDKHSPLNSGKVGLRVGLSKRARIAPLLRMVGK